MDLPEQFESTNIGMITAKVNGFESAVATLLLSGLDIRRFMNRGCKFIDMPGALVVQDQNGTALRVYLQVGGGNGREWFFSGITFQRAEQLPLILYANGLLSEILLKPHLAQLQSISEMFCEMKAAHDGDCVPKECPTNTTLDIFLYPLRLLFVLIKAVVWFILFIFCFPVFCCSPFL